MGKIDEYKEFWVFEAYELSVLFSIFNSGA